MAVAVYPLGVVCSRRFFPGPGGRRGKVFAFSSRSRRRLRLCILSRIDSRAVGERRLLWVTLTIPSGDAHYIKAVFRTAVEHLRYRNIPYFLIWRLEYQRRGVPHLHILLLSESTAAVLSAARVLVSNFVRIAGASVRAQCVKFVKNASRLSVYVSDMGKLTQSDFGSDHPGRWWGYRGNIDTVIYPVVVDGLVHYFDCLRFFRALRRSRVRGRRRKRWRGGRRGLLSEFFDTSFDNLRFVSYLLYLRS